MSPLVTGWLTGCRNFWWFHFFSFHQFTLHLLVNRWEIRSFHRWLLIHRCQQHQNSSLTLENEETTTTCEFNSRTVESAQNLLASLDECFDAFVHQLRDTQNWSLHINDCEAHSKFFALTPEVYSPRTVVFQQLTSRGLERGTWPVAPVSTRSSTNSPSRICASSDPTTSSQSQPDYASSSISVEIVPVVDGAVPAEDKPGGGGGGVTRVVLLLALLFGGSTDSSSSTSVLLLVSPLSTVTTIALKLRTALVFTPCPCLSCHWRVCLSCLYLRAQRRFPLARLPLAFEWLGCHDRLRH